jgi:hypothetical protein
MKDELRELSKQAYQRFVENEDVDYWQHFGEMIVEECLAMCAVKSDEASLDYERGVIFAVNRCRQNIKDQFGVEE